MKYTNQKIVTFTAPSHWASALVNGDETGFDYYGDEKDYREYMSCHTNLVDQYGNASVIDCEEIGFCTSGDYGNLAGDYSTYALIAT